MSNINAKPVTRLTDLEVYEVSLVDKGAIGEVFTVIKSEDENDELVNKITSSDICEKLQNMPDADFVHIMGQMMSRYNSINKNVNKGGTDNMNPEDVKTLVAEVVGEAMDTVNKNFVSINKSIDELQKNASTQEDEAAKADEAKKAEEAKAESEVAKAVTAIGEAVKGLGEAVSEISKSLAGVTEQVQKMSDLKLDETLGDVTKRLETIEKQENPSNGVGATEEVQKNEGQTQVFWKSFLGTPDQE